VHERVQTIARDRVFTLVVARDQVLRLPQLLDCQVEDPHQAHQLTQEEEVKLWSVVRVFSLCPRPEWL
jgi:hypothetical protein